MGTGETMQKKAGKACRRLRWGVFSLVAAIAAYGTDKVPWMWPFLFCAVQGIGFMYFWPPFLALVSRAAPPKINATSPSRVKSDSALPNLPALTHASNSRTVVSAPTVSSALAGPPAGRGSVDGPAERRATTRCATMRR